MNRLTAALRRSALLQLLQRIPAPHSPRRILAVVALAVFLGETLVMLVIAHLPPMPLAFEAVLDASLLILSIFPVLYLFLFRPLLDLVAEQKKTEEKLRNSGDMLQTVFDGISDPLILLDHKLRLKMLNRAAAQYYELGAKQVFDLPCHKALRDHDSPCDECRVPESMAENRSVHYERKSFKDPRRTEKVVIYRAGEKNGQPGAAIIRVSDITDEKLMEKQLLQREKMASLGLLITSIAHEINNPNNFITFNLPILRDYLNVVLPIVDEHDRLHPEQEYFHMTYAEFRADLFNLLDNMSHGSTRINEIVTQIKGFAILKAQKNKVPVHLPRLVNKVLIICRNEINRTVKNFIADVSEQLPVVFTDSEALEQVMINLLINACQASDKADSRVRLSLDLQAAEGHERLSIEVSDNGVGMDPETRKHIFDPLFTTKDPKSGTGLGLYVCHNLVEGLGGEILVESKVHEGSRFLVSLPVALKESRPENGAVSEPAS